MSTPPTSPRVTRYLLTCGLAGPAFLIAVLVQDALRPGYEPLHHFVSELSNGPYGWIQSANFLVAGTLLLGFALGLRRALPDGRGRLAAPVLTGICGAALVWAGVFTMDPAPGWPVGGTGTPHPTTAGQLHGYAPIAVFLSLAALAFVMARRFSADPRRPGRRHRGWLYYSLITGTLAPAAFMITAGMYDFHAQTGHHHGLWNRISLAIALTWLGALTVRLLRDHPGTPGRRQVLSP